MSVRVRRPELSDADRLAVVNLETWRRAYAGIVPASYLDGLELAAFEERWHRNLTQGRPGVSFLVAEVDGLVASYAIVGAYRTQQDADPAEDTGRWGEIYAIYTHPALQGRGAGGAVHEAALVLLREQAYRQGALWVLAENTASRDWYAARGWRPDGATSQWHGAGTPLDEVRLRHDLAGD